MIPTSVLILAAGSAIFWMYPGKNRPEYAVSAFGNPVMEIRIADDVFMAEAVSSAEKRMLGLSGREEMCHSCAMLFIFPEPARYSFWMKDMKFNLDIVWISGASVKSIEKNVPFAEGEREVVRPDAPIDKVLEFNAGVSDEIGLKIGDEIHF
ncbi:MAG: DUF192 domain-containing protein [Candidatus Moranbacteria bacterium]|nr:DUF192 domain-containing protein [Candidatus Moranbacteria bacterium]